MPGIYDNAHQPNTRWYMDQHGAGGCHYWRCNRYGNRYITRYNGHILHHAIRLLFYIYNNSKPTGTDTGQHNHMPRQHIGTQLCNTGRHMEQQQPWSSNSESFYRLCNISECGRNHHFLHHPAWVYRFGDLYSSGTTGSHSRPNERVPGEYDNTDQRHTGRHVDKQLSVCSDNRIADRDCNRGNGRNYNHFLYIDWWMLCSSGDHGASDNTNNRAYSYVYRNNSYYE